MNACKKKLKKCLHVTSLEGKSTTSEQNLYGDNEVGNLETAT